jgi:hypothetical protein
MFQELLGQAAGSGISTATKNILSPTLATNNASTNNSTRQANMTLNQSIYANTVALPKMNGGSAVRHGSNGSGSGSGSTGSSSNNNNGKNNLNISKLSSSNSPATTNQTKTSYMDSSRDHSHHELENTQLSPIGRSASTSRPAMFSPRTGVPLSTRHDHHQRSPQRSPPPLFGNTNHQNRFLPNSSLMSNGDIPNLSLTRPSGAGGGLNTTVTPNGNVSNLSSLTSNGHQITSNLHQTTSKKQHQNPLMNASFLPGNVSKFMILSKEAGVRVAITSLGLLCLVSLLFALLSLVFLLRISPASENAESKYQFDFLSPSEFVSLYEVTLTLCALTLMLNLCCLLVCAIQFVFAIKLVKAPHGRQR